MSKAGKVWLKRSLLCIMVLIGGLSSLGAAISDIYLHKLREMLADVQGGKLIIDSNKKLNKIANRVHDIARIFQYSDAILKLETQFLIEIKHLGYEYKSSEISAIDNFNRILGSAPTSDSSYLEYASYLYHQRGRESRLRDTCLQLYNSSIRLNNMNAYNHFALANCLYSNIEETEIPDKGIINKVCEEYGLALMLSRQFGRGEVYNTISNIAYANCLGVTHRYELLRKLNPWQSPEWVSLAKALIENGGKEWEANKELFIDDLARDDFQLGCYWDVANYLGSLGRLRDGVQVLQGYVGRYSRDSQGWKSLIKFMENYRGHFSAIEFMNAFSDAQKLSSPGPKEWILMGRAACKIGAFNSTSIFFRSVLERWPKDLEAWLSLGQCFVSSNRLETAKEIYLEALLLDPKAADAWSGLAEIYSCLMQYTLAVDSAYKALRYDPGNMRALKILNSQGMN